MIRQDNFIELEHLPPELQPRNPAELDSRKHYSTLKDIEKFHISVALRKYAGNRGYAAKELGINVSTLYRKIIALKIKPPSIDGRYRQ